MHLIEYDIPSYKLFLLDTGILYLQFVPDSIFFKQKIEIVD